MARKPILSVLLALGLCALTRPAEAQNCSPPIITPNAKTYNIFSPEQEMVLGELTYQRMSGELRFVRDQQLLAYVTEIGEKLIKHLPPTGLKFQFLIVDLPTANAYNIPGGYVFISRKLIGFANNEDELAGVIAHELGHATVRHGASDMSEHFKKILNVTQLGDRKDVVEKYNLFLERWRTKKTSVRSDHESRQQLEADRIGLFALVAAGYDPNAFGNLFDRMVETKGKTGNWFSDVFGTIKPEEKRLREMIKLTEQLPAQCRDSRRIGASEAFREWQADVVSYRDLNKKEELKGLIWKRELAPKLRSDISHFSFSHNGKYILAQDDFGITIIQREPLLVTFQIPTKGANPATFTADDLFVVFGTKNLRYEKWSLAEKKPVEIRELVVRRDCWQYKLSPDGKYLTCLDYGFNLNLLETETGKKIWEKKEFHQLTFLEYLNFVILRMLADGDDDAATIRLVNIEFSPDSQFLAVSSRSSRSFVALDLRTVTKVSVGGGISQLTRQPFLFLDSNRILAMGADGSEDSGIFSFPEGKRLAKFPLGGEELERTANPNYVIVKPLANARMGVFDLSKNMLVSGLNTADAALWNNLMVFEGTSGKMRISEVNYDDQKKGFQFKEVGGMDIPAISIGRVSVAAVSDNFQWLAVSSKSRGALWNLGSGERKMFLRGFRGVVLANDGTGVGEFPKLEPINHSLVLLNPGRNTADPLKEIPERGAKQYGRFVMTRQSLKESKKANAPLETGASLEKEVRMELRDLITDKQVWTRDFPKEAPNFFFDEFSGRLIFYWDLGSDVGKTKLKEDPALAARAKEMGNKDDDFLVEIVDALAGKTIGLLLLETGKGSFKLESGYSEGSWLVLHDSNNRILAYSIMDGELRHRFFGGEAAINPSRNQLVVENYPGELTLYDLTTGDTITRLHLSSDAAFVRFGLDGKRLFVLSSEQTAYAFDVDKLVSTLSSTRQ